MTSMSTSGTASAVPFVAIRSNPNSLAFLAIGAIFGLSISRTLRNIFPSVGRFMPADSCAL